jgi:hypothetical protein
VQKRSREEAGERERAGREGMPAQKEHGREPDEDPLESRRSLTASSQSESTHRGQPRVPTMLSAKGGRTASSP